MLAGGDVGIVNCPNTYKAIPTTQWDRSQDERKPMEATAQPLRDVLMMGLPLLQM